jgi:hypothetical protein
MENYQTEANSNSNKKKKMELDWTHITQRRRKPHEFGILRGIEEELGRRERGEGQQRMK